MDLSDSSYRTDGPTADDLDPIDEVNHFFRDARELLDELLAETAAGHPDAGLDADAIECHAEGMFTLGSILAEACSWEAGCDERELEDDPLDPIGLAEWLAEDLVPLIGHGRRLVDKAPPRDSAAAHELSEAVDALAESKGRLDRLVARNRPF